MTLHNVITVTGNATADAELRFTPSGAAVSNFTVAVNSRKRNEDGTWEDLLDGFFRVNVWREMGENVAETIKKGDRVTVIGRVKIRTYDKKDGGGTGYSTEIEADEVAMSLRWATAQVTRQTKKDTADRPGSGATPPKADWGAPAPVPDPMGVEEGGF